MIKTEKELCYEARTKDLVYKAMRYAMEKHSTQERKYTYNPYWNHLAEVAALLNTINDDPDTLAIAWLHDTLEDTNATEEEIHQLFGGAVASGVKMLSDLDKGNRKERMELSRERLSNAPAYIQDIKVCDIISNTSSILKHDPKFAKVYLEEKRLLLDCLTKADNRLMIMAKEIIVDTLY